MWSGNYFLSSISIDAGTLATHYIHCNEKVLGCIIVGKDMSENMCIVQMVHRLVVQSFQWTLSVSDLVFQLKHTLNFKISFCSIAAWSDSGSSTFATPPPVVKLLRQITVNKKHRFQCLSVPQTLIVLTEGAGTAWYLEMGEGCFWLADML